MLNNKLLTRFKDYYRDLLAADLAALDEIYSVDILFKDPIHEIKGLACLQDYFASLCGNLVECRTEYLDQLVSQNSAYIKWIMHFRHPRLGNSLISIRGISHLCFDQRIFFHEDSYDMGAMLYEHLPLLGPVVRLLRRRLAQ